MAFNPIHHQLLPLQLRDRLSLVSIEAEVNPFHATSSFLYQFVRRTVVRVAQVSSLDSFYLRNVVVWNRHYADWVISDIYAILKLIYADMLRYDLNTVQFDPEKLERELKFVEDFIKTICKEHIPLQFATHFDLSHIENQCAHIGSVLPLCRKMLDVVAVRVRFEKSPSISDRGSLLWKKVHRINATSLLLLEGCIDPVCPVCREEELLEDGNFAIVDCGDVLCVKCAKRTLDLPNYQESRCPMCLDKVTAWTDHQHFLFFKSSMNPKMVLWRLLSNLRKNNAHHPNHSWHWIDSRRCLSIRVEENTK